MFFSLFARGQEVNLIKIKCLQRGQKEEETGLKQSLLNVKEKTAEDYKVFQVMRMTEVGSQTKIGKSELLEGAHKKKQLGRWEVTFENLKEGQQKLLCKPQLYINQEVMKLKTVTKLGKGR